MASLTEFDATDDTNLSGTNGKVALVSLADRPDLWR